MLEIPLHSFLGIHPRVFLGGFTEPSSISARAGVVVPAENRFGKSAQKTPWVPRNVRESVPEAQEPLNSQSRARNPELSSDLISLQHLGSVDQKVGAQGLIYPEIKGHWLN